MYGGREMGVTKEFRLFRKPSDSDGTKDWAIAKDGELLFGKTGATLRSVRVPAQSVSNRIVNKQRDGYAFLGNVYFNEDGRLVNPPTELEKPKTRPVPRRIAWRCVPEMDTERFIRFKESAGLLHVMQDVATGGVLKVEESMDAAKKLLHLLALKKAIDADVDFYLQIVDPNAESIRPDPRKEMGIMALFGIKDFEEIRQISEELGLIMKPLEILVNQDEPCYDY